MKIVKSNSGRRLEPEPEKRMGLSITKNDQNSKSRQSLKTIISKPSLNRISSKLGLRRRSISYPEMFEGDISAGQCRQTLFLSPDYSSRKPKEFGDQELGGLSLNIDKHKTKKNIQQKLFSTWFFKRQNEGISDEELHLIRKDDISNAPDMAEDKKKSKISELISKRFTAAKDFRNLNVIVPQSM